MGFHVQFKVFDPISGDVPNHPFSLLPEIARRARNLLKGRTVEQIDSVARDIDWAIYEYFHTVKEEEIARLQNELMEPRNWRRISATEEACYHEAEQFFDWDGSANQDNGRWIFKEGMEDKLEIPTAQNTSEVEALKECIDWFVDIGGEDFPDSKPYELFAVLSLWMLGDALSWLRPRQQGGKFDEVMAGIDWAMAGISKLAGVENHVSVHISLAGESALNAMDAVCYAELLRDVETLEKSHTLKLAEVNADYLNKAAEQQEEIRKQRSMKAEKLNIFRHQKTYEAKAKAIEEWERDTSKFSSAEKAGNHLADWLALQGLQYEPRTVTKWIRDYAKKVGIRLR